MTDIRPTAVYLSGPMLDRTGDFHHKDAMVWREQVAALASMGVLFVSPAHAFYGSNEMTAVALDRVERHMIVACDGVLAVIPPGERVFGTVRDIEFARAQGKPVAVAGEVASLMAHDLFVAPSTEDALQLLLDAIRTDRDTPRGMMLMLGMPGAPDDEE